MRRWVTSNDEPNDKVGNPPWCMEGLPAPLPPPLATIATVEDAAAGPCVCIEDDGKADAGRNPAARRGTGVGASAVPAANSDKRVELVAAVFVFVFEGCGCGCGLPIPWWWAT